MREVGKDLKALIVDCDAEGLACLQGSLEKAGWVCDEANDAESALALLDQTFYHGVFMEVFLPKMGGEELLLELQRRWPDLPVVITSLEDSEPVIERFLRLGACAYLVKPVADKEIRKVTAFIRGMQIVNSPAAQSKTPEERDHFMLINRLLQQKEYGGRARRTGFDPTS